MKINNPNDITSVLQLYNNIQKAICDYLDLNEESDWEFISCELSDDPNYVHVFKKHRKYGTEETSKVPITDIFYSVMSQEE